MGKNKSFDIAYEMRLFDKLNLSVGYYNRISDDLLFNSITTINRSPSKPENVGSLANSGFEAEVSWDAVRNDNFRVNFNANVSTLNNEIKKLPVGRDSIQSGNFRRVVGRSIYDYYMRRFAGVNPNNGNARWYMRNADGNDVTTEDFSEADRYF